MKKAANSPLSTLHSSLSSRLVSGLFWVLLANVIVKPLWLLGIEVGVQNAVGNEVYGFYISIFNLSYIFNILLDLGVTNFNTRNIAQHPQLIGKHLSGILSLKLLLLGLYAVVTFTVGALLGYGSEEFRLLMWLCVAQFLNSLILYLRSNFEGLLLFRWDSLFSVLDRVLMIVICGFLLWGSRSGRWPVAGGQFSIYHFVYAQVFAYAVTALLALIVIGRKARLRRLRWNWPFCLVILRRSAPFALLVLLMASYNRIDPILLRRLATDADAGIYAGAFRLLDALTMVAYLVSVPLLPVFSRITAPASGERRVESGERRVENVKLSTLNSQLSTPNSELRTPNSELVSVLRIVFWPMMLFAVGSAVACSLMARPLMDLLYHAGGAPYVPVFRVVIFGIVPIGLTYIFGTLLTAGGHLRQLNIFAASSLVLNVVANLLLIPRLGAVGSAWASLTTQSFMAVLQVVLAIRLFHLPLLAFMPPSPREAINFAKTLTSKH